MTAETVGRPTPDGASLTVAAGGFDLREWAGAKRISLKHPRAKERIQAAFERDVQRAFQNLLDMQLAAGLRAAGMTALEDLTPDNALRLAQVDWAGLMRPGAVLSVQAVNPFTVTQDDIAQAQRAAVDELMKAASAGVQQARLGLEAVGIPFYYDLADGFVNDEARRWALQHGAATIDRMHGTTRRWVQETVASFLADVVGQVDLNEAFMRELTSGAVARLGWAFSAARAETIAITEVTTALYEGSVRQYAKAGIRRVRWESANDSLVCPTCGPMNQVTAELDHHTYQVRWPNGLTIPAHPRCRCGAAPVLD